MSNDQAVFLGGCLLTGVGAICVTFGNDSAITLVFITGMILAAVGFFAMYSSKSPKSKKDPE